MCPSKTIKSFPKQPTFLAGYNYAVKLVVEEKKLTREQLKEEIYKEMIPTDDFERGMLYFCNQN